MRMSIDEAIHDTEVIKEYLECRRESRSEGLEVAIDIMRKYQKIAKAIDKVEEYICDVETDTVKAQGMAQALDMFEQALGEDEDGKD